MDTVWGADEEGGEREFMNPKDTVVICDSGNEEVSLLVNNFSIITKAAAAQALLSDYPRLKLLPSGVIERREPIDRSKSRHWMVAEDLSALIGKTFYLLRPSFQGVRDQVSVSMCLDRLNNGLGKFTSLERGEAKALVNKWCDCFEQKDYEETEREIIGKINEFSGKTFSIPEWRRMMIDEVLAAE